MATVDGPISLAAYAAHRGCSTQAVSKAIKAQRLVRSVVRIHDQPKIADVTLADHEWTANVRRARRPPPAAVPAQAQASVDEPRDESGGNTLFEAQRQATLQLARKRRLENEVAEGQLVDAEAVRVRMAGIFLQCRTKLLALPNKAKSLLPHLTLADVLMLDRLTRESLEALADPATVTGATT